MPALAAVLALVAAGEWVDLTWDTALSSTPERDDFRPLVERALDQAVEHATRTLRVRLSTAVRAHVYTRTTYAQRFGEDMGAWAAAHYRAGTIHVNGGARIDRDFEALVTHEMVHALLDHRGGGRAFPVWINEGLAERARYQVLGLAALEPNQRMELKAVLAETPVTALPSTGRLSHGQYLASWAAVVRLVEQRGEEKLLELVRRVLDGGDFERTFESLMGMDVARFIRGFYDSAGVRPPESRRLKFR